ncbi:hypothetical protein [Marinobacter sp. KMM 10035]|uniref:hypothetical protein n=1 Tax=Marinobacter sp. KMM 10035 TaxID=3134034 RepID=UPI00397CE42D
MTSVSRYSGQFAKQALGALFGLCFAGAGFAELEGLSENEMSEIDGAGIGVVLENFKFSHGTDQPDANGDRARVFRIAGIKSTDGRDVDITVNRFYVSGANSNYGESLTPVNIGRLINPWRIDVVDGNNIGIAEKAVFEIAAPAMVAAAEGFDCLSSSAVAGTGTCSSRPATADFVGERPDIGMQVNVGIGADRTGNVNIHAKSAVVDGSYLRLWGDEARKQMVAQFKLNFYSPELAIDVCAQDGTACGSRIYMSDVVMELALGNQLQPLFLDVDGGGNFVIDIASIRKPLAGEIGANGLRASSNPEAWDSYNAYYTDPEYRSNLSIGNFSVGNRDFGSARIQGVLIQHLNIRTKDL